MYASATYVVIGATFVEVFYFVQYGGHLKSVFNFEFENCSSSVSIVTWLQAECLRNRGSIPSRGKRVFSSAYCAD
jgi:hypothetical protein